MPDPSLPPGRTEEYFDVVDESDAVIDVRPRSEVHRRGLLHRAVHVFVFQPDGRMLIHKRSDAKEEFPSVWTSSCSGHVSAGETYDETAPRELLEELGLQHPALTRVHKFPAGPATSWEFTVLYSCVSSETPVPDPVEMTAIQWLFPGEIAAWTARSPADFSPAFLLLFSWFHQKQSQ